MEEGKGRKSISVRFGETDCEIRVLNKLVRDRVQLWGTVLAPLNLRLQLSHSLT
jgi:hypothetical protein